MRFTSLWLFLGCWLFAPMAFAQERPDTQNSVAPAFAHVWVTLRARSLIVLWRSGTAAEIAVSTYRSRRGETGPRCGTPSKCSNRLARSVWSSSRTCMVFSPHSW